MQIQGITWHAVVLKADEFAATKKLVTEVFGLTSLIEQDGWALFPMSNGTILDLYAPYTFPPTASMTASSSASGSTTSRQLQRSSRRRDASFLARSRASRG